MYDHWQSIKEVIRHTLFRTGLDGMLEYYRKTRGRDVSHLQKDKLGEIFTDVYLKGIWLEDAGQTTLSGAGSTKTATDRFSGDLSAFLKEVDCKRLIDIGCGDFGWMQNVQGEFDYLGIDVVKNVIDENNLKYGSPRRKFNVMDATRDYLPDGDVVICREVIFHLSLSDARKLISNIATSGYRYLIMTTDSSVWFNSDIRSGDFRRLNLNRSPFNFPEPVREFHDEGVHKGRKLAVWQNIRIEAKKTARS
jgi:2-polyprenyl-3-methyl-5-hydroxy-6-metoxy-1,4-benzoquinol methylase